MKRSDFIGVGERSTIDDDAFLIAWDPTDPNGEPFRVSKAGFQAELASRYVAVTNERLSFLDPRVGGVAGTSSSAAQDTALAAADTLMATNGGELFFPPGWYRFDNQFRHADDAASSYPRQPARKWAGSGAYADPKGGSGPYPDLTGIGGTVLDFRYTGGGSGLAKIDTRGKGMWECEGITFTDQGTSSNPFIKTTNTTLMFHDNAFVGNPSKAGTTCDQDVFILGGTDSDAGGEVGPNATFQGYGTVIKENQFHRIRRAALLQNYANGIVVRDNNIWISCGSDLAGGAAIELAPTYQSVFGNVIAANLIEVGHYPYGIKADFAQGNSFLGNNFFDPSVTTLAYIRMASTNAKNNTIITGYGGTSYPHVSEAVASQNTIIDNSSISGTYPGLSQSSNPHTFHRGLTTAVLNNVGSGNPEVTFGAGTNPPGLYVIASGTPAFAAPTGSICVVKSAVLGRTLFMKEFGTSTSGWKCVGTESLIFRTTVTKTSNFTAADDDIIICNGGAMTLTLPTAVGITGRVYTVKNINSTSLPIATTSSQTIDGTTPASLAQWATRNYVSDGANWLTI